MSLAEIVDIAEVAELLNSGLTDANRAKLVSIKGRVENTVRRYLEHNITQPTSPYVHYLPNRPSSYMDFDSQEIDLLPNGKVSLGTYSQYADILQLPQTFLRSIVEIREDLNALDGVGASIFTSEDLLTENVDYRVDWDEPGLSEAGQIVRIGRGWPSCPRTVRVIYVAGLTADELDNEYSDIKDAVIEETILRFNLAQSRSAGAVGPVKSESLGGEYSVTYDTSDKFVTSGGSLSQGAMEKLEPFVSINF